LKKRKKNFPKERVNFEKASSIFFIYKNIFL